MRQLQGKMKLSISYSHKGYNHQTTILLKTLMSSAASASIITIILNEIDVKP